MSTQKEEPRLPGWGYVVLVVVAGLLLTGLFAACYLVFEGQVQLRPIGLAPVLIFVWLCFIAACIYDYVFDRFRHRSLRRRRAAQRRVRDSRVIPIADE